MAGYYVYFVGADRRFSKRVAILCDDDEEAVRLAKQLLESQPIELWQEARMIAAFEPE